MATSMMMEQTPSVVVPTAEQPQPQQERPVEAQEEDAAAADGTSKPMDVDASQEKQPASGSEDAPAAAAELQPDKDVEMDEVTENNVAKQDAAAKSNAPEEETPVTTTSTTAKPEDNPGDVETSEAPQDKVMASTSPRSQEKEAETPMRVVENAEETRRRAIERATRRLKIQLEFVENARRKVLDETHPDMAAQLESLARERTRMEELAHMRAAQFEHGTSVIFAYECDEANSEFEMQCEKLRQEMLEEIHNEMEIINDQRKGGATSARKTSRNTRSTRGKNGSDHVPFAFDTAQKIKKRAGYVFQPLENKLAQSEVDHDLRELTATFEATKKRRVDIDAASLPLVKYYRSRLLYRDWIFQEGDEVYVMNYTASSEYVAVICGITPSEMIVLSEKGKYCRLVLMDLRQGRVVLSTLDGGLARDDESFASS